MKTAISVIALSLVATPVLADEYARVLASVPIVEQVAGSTNSRLAGYQVTYQYQGSTFTVRLPTDPGPQLRIQSGSGAPMITQTNVAPPVTIIEQAPQTVYVNTPAPPVVYGGPAPYYPAPYYPTPYYAPSYYNPIVPLAVGVGVGAIIGGAYAANRGGYYGGYRGGYRGGWHR
jgi:hypothetical protein